MNLNVYLYTHYNLRNLLADSNLWNTTMDIIIYCVNKYDEKCMIMTV